MSWGDDFNGGPHHIGICPECGQYNGSCYDGTCDSCEALKPVECPECGEMVDILTTHGICQNCLHYKEIHFTNKVFISTHAERLLTL